MEVNFHNLASELHRRHFVFFVLTGVSSQRSRAFSPLCSLLKAEIFRLHQDQMHSEPNALVSSSALSRLVPSAQSPCQPQFLAEDDDSPALSAGV